MSQKEDIGKIESQSSEKSVVESSKIESSETSSATFSSIEKHESLDTINEANLPSSSHSTLSIVTVQRDSTLLEVPDIQSAVEISSSTVPSTVQETETKTPKKTYPSPVKGFLSNIVQKFQSFSSSPKKEPVVEEYIAGQELMEDSFIKIPTRHSSKKTQTSPVERPSTSKRAGRFLMSTEAYEGTQTDKSSTSGTIDERDLSKSSTTNFDVSKMSLTLEGAEPPKCKSNLYERFKEIVRLSVNKKEEEDSCARTSASIATQTKVNRKINTETTLQHQELAIGVNAAFQNLSKFYVPTKIKYSDSDTTDISNDSSEPSTDFSTSAKDETSDSSESKEGNMVESSEPATPSSRNCESALIEIQKTEEKVKTEEMQILSVKELEHETIQDIDPSDISLKIPPSKVLPHEDLLSSPSNIPEPLSASCSVDSEISPRKLIETCLENISNEPPIPEELNQSSTLEKNNEPENQSDQGSFGGLKRKQSSSETVEDSSEFEQKEIEKKPSKRPNNLND